MGSMEVSILGLLVLITTACAARLGPCHGYDDECLQECHGYECLKEYVERPDSAYRWEDTGHRLVVGDYLGRGGWTGYYLNLTSQQWLTEEETSHPLWWHILVVVVPDHLEVLDIAGLWITDGDNKNWDFQPDLTDYNTDHITVTGILELLPAVNTWVKELYWTHSELKKKYNGERPPVTTIEERNDASIELMSVSVIPRFNWTIDEETGDITVQSEKKPKSVHLWHASTCNDERRDFRLTNNDDPCECGIVVQDMCFNLRIGWASQELEESSPGSLTWVAHQRPPIDGRWKAFFVDLQFDGTVGRTAGWPAGRDGILEFTTSISIVPNTFPYEECVGAECLGDLV